MPRRLLLLTVSLACLVSLSAAGVREPSPELRAKVKQLLGQLEGADANAQNAAEWDLLRLGPEILPLLPPGGKAGRLRAVRDTLTELMPRTFTLQRDRVTLKEALAELARQTGVVVADRSGRRPDATFALKCKDLPFWQALDALAAASGARASLYGPDGGLALEPKTRPDGAAGLPVSYHGAFRTALKHMAVSQDLETGAHTCVVQLDLAWEPRLPVFLVETAPAAITFADDAKGKALRANLPGRGRDLVKAPGSVHELSLRMPAPERSSPAIAALRGTVVVTGASKLLTFTFDKLRETGPKHKGEAQTRERVRVQLLDISRETDPDRFSFEVSIANPPAGPRFESHESAAGAWMAHNAIWLENKRTRQRLQPNRLTEDVAREARYAVVRYDFMQRDNPGVRFGQLSDWVLYYRTPGRMVEVTVPYEFKNVPLP